RVDAVSRAHLVHDIHSPANDCRGRGDGVIELHAGSQVQRQTQRLLRGVSGMFRAAHELRPVGSDDFRRIAPVPQEQQSGEHAERKNGPVHDRRSHTNLNDAHSKPTTWLPPTPSFTANTPLNPSAFSVESEPRIYHPAASC